VPATGYRRELDLERAMHTVTYESEGVKYRREAFASFPAKVMVFRFSADKPGALTGTVTLTDMHKGTVKAWATGSHRPVRLPAISMRGISPTPWP